MRFVLPTEENKKDVLDFYEEFENHDETCIGFALYKDFSSWLTQMKNRKSGTNLPKGYVRENFYLCYENEKLIGVFSLKFELTEYLFNFGGHIGYAVRPSMRNQGWATKILKQGLEVARDYKFKKLLVVVDEDNLPSIHVVLHNKGMLENTVYDSKEDVYVKRFWINIE